MRPNRRAPRLAILLLLGFSLSIVHTAHSQDEAGVEKHAFQAEVSRMMKLIINSLYTNKEIFLRELISNASDALDKIRVLALTDKDTLDSLGELEIRIKADDARGALHVMDTGVGMSKSELITNLGTIAKSGTSEFIKKSLDNPEKVQLNDLIGQFGVGFYSSFLVADKVSVRSKSHQEPFEHVWESNSTEFSVKQASVEDRLDGSDQLKRGSVVTLHLKDEAKDFLKPDTLRELIKKYSQFINFPIYLWTSKTVTEEVPVDDDESTDEKKDEDATSTTEKPTDDVLEEEKAETKKKTKKVEKTVYDWERINVAKPIWQRKPKDISDEEYDEFYKSITRDHQPPIVRTHFTAEGELTFKSLLFIPKVQPTESFNKYGNKNDNIKLYVKRVFISDDFNDLMPAYMRFIRGVVDSEDLPLNVGRETLQQHKLLKVIKKKLVRKTLDMIKKIDDNKYIDFWKEFGTNLKLGIIEDQNNRNRIAKLLRFHSSKTGPDGWTSLEEYVKNMLPEQEQIFYIAGSSYDEVSQSPFVESVLKKGYEVLYLTDAVDEYTLSNLPDFDGKRFQNVAKEGLTLDKSKKRELYKKALEGKYAKLVSYLQETALKGKVHKVVLSERLSESPAALVATAFGWTGNMERLAKSNAHSKTNDATRDYYLQQKKILEINPHHPVIKELLKRVEADESDERVQEAASMVFAIATVRSGYMLQDLEDFGKKIERYMRTDLHVPLDAPVEEEQIEVPEEESATKTEESTKTEEEPTKEDESTKADDEPTTEEKPETATPRTDL
uniref:Heat shock protein 83 n=1 Tax=Aceria tosichella TaxID=561515 RepID=A0A6G1S9Q3_9ACAR